MQKLRKYLVGFLESNKCHQYVFQESLYIGGLVFAQLHVKNKPIPAISDGILPRGIEFLLNLELINLKNHYFIPTTISDGRIYLGNSLFTFLNPVCFINDSIKTGLHPCHKDGFNL